MLGLDKHDTHKQLYTYFTTMSGSFCCICVLAMGVARVLIGREERANPTTTHMTRKSRCACVKNLSVYTSGAALPFRQRQGMMACNHNNMCHLISLHLQLLKGVTHVIWVACHHPLPLPDGAPCFCDFWPYHLYILQHFRDSEHPNLMFMKESTLKSI